MFLPVRRRLTGATLRRAARRPAENLPRSPLASAAPGTPDLRGRRRSRTPCRRCWTRSARRRACGPRRPGTSSGAPARTTEPGRVLSRRRRRSRGLSVSARWRIAQALRARRRIRRAACGAVVEAGGATLGRERDERAATSYGTGVPAAPRRGRRGPAIAGRPGAAIACGNAAPAAWFVNDCLGIRDREDDVRDPAVRCVAVEHDEVPTRSTPGARAQSRASA
jgi:hypothetical protein